MLSRNLILLAFTHLSEELKKRGVLGEINIVGGTAMVLAFNARESTKDVDAIFHPSLEVRTAAGIVAENLSLPVDWLNDGAKGFLSQSNDFEPLYLIDLPNLRLQAPTPQYMLAMKVLSARSAVNDERGDARDIAFLIRLLGLTSASQVMEIVNRYYDPSRILPRSLYLVDEILEEMQA